MRAVVIDRSGRLVIEHRPEPEPAPGQTLIRVRAAGVNFADILARQGLYPDAPPRPFVPGYEVAGDTPDGRRVVAFTRFGGYSEAVVVPDDEVLPLPEGYSYEEGAGFLVTGATAAVAMLGYGPLREGDRVLIHAAAGGVGMAAVQIGLAHGAELFGTAGSDEKCQALADLGVAHPINYRKEDWPSRVGALGGNLDLVLDSLGGASIRKGLALLRPGGRLVAFGVAAGAGKGPLGFLAAMSQGALLPVYPLLMRSKALIGLNLLALAENPGRFRHALEPLKSLVAAGKLRPHIGARFPLERAIEAHRLIESRTTIGKVVLTVG